MLAGLPVGLQLVGMPGREPLLFDLAARIESARQ
jgi:Asp-tRNA(Asn)/Glu-tRNA(Gln) amidotransferase A subunit family amidase